MKKVFTFCLSVLLMLCAGVQFVSCAPSKIYCNPKGKKWYNASSLPTISHPFNNLYDGCYTIAIDKSGKVLFSPFEGKELQGELSIVRNEYNQHAEISVTFQSGETATGTCYYRTQDNERVLVISYNGKGYAFYGERTITKEEFDAHRTQLIAFFTNVYQTGVFPSQEEIENNQAYQKFTEYHQIDPCCGGPIIYDVLFKATIKNDQISFTMDEEERTDSVYEVNGAVFALIKNEEITPLTFDDLTDGECLVSVRSRRITGIFYIEP